MASVTHGRAVGRYVLEECLGRGGTGIVHAAWDPRLSRRVAIKLVHAGLRETSGDARLMREARALARVRHPNVIEIYDVGVHQDDGYCVYLVMELVRGLDGHRWLRERPRDQQDVLTVFLAAARGLVAAHEAGVLHRDFKPANMLVGDDGRVRVLDFGLARAIVDDDAEHSSDERASWSGSGESSQQRWFAPAVTHDGLVMGTPSFMAPEQHAGLPMDVRTDVYNFCASLWLGLSGTMPFPGKMPSELAALKRRGPPSPPRAVPPSTAAIFAVLARGLAPDPDDRFASMDALVHALDQARTRPSSRPARIALAAAVVVLAGSSLVVGRDAPACEDGGHEVAGSWTAAARTRVHDAIADDLVAATVIADIDAWAAGWSQMRTDACAIPAPDERDRVLACLRRHQRALAAAIDVLATSDSDAGKHAWRVLAQLPSPSACESPAGAEHDPQSDAVADELVAARTLAVAGRLSDAQDRLAVAESAAARIDSAVLAVDVEMTRGEVLDGLALHADAAAAFERAYLLATDAGLDAEAADAASKMVLVYGAHDPDANADAWVRRAEAALARLGDDPAREAGLHSNIAGMLATRGDFADALARIETAERISLAAGETDVVATAMHREKKGRLLAELGELEPAGIELEAAATELGRALGERHSVLVTVCAELGHVRRKQGRLDEALALYERSFAILEESEEPDHPELALAHNNLAIVKDELERWSEAVPHYELALAVIERHHGADHPWAGSLHHNLGINLAAQEHYAPALARFARARAIWEPTLGADHPEIGKTWLAQGEVHAALGDLDQAIADFERAIMIFEGALADDHPELVPPLLHLALAHARRDDVSEARSLAERALAIATRRLGDEHPKTARALAVSSLFATDRGRARVGAQRAAERLADVPGERPGLGLALLVQARTSDEPAEARRLARVASETLHGGGPSFTRWADEADRLR